jgi:hypothetical protein
MPRLSGNAAQKAPDGVLRQVPGGALAEAAGDNSRGPRQGDPGVAQGGVSQGPPTIEPSGHSGLWLDSWPGIGHVVVGIAHQDFDLQLTRYDERGWRATFYTTGMEHSAASATGSAWEPTPWHAVEEPQTQISSSHREKMKRSVRRAEVYFARKCLKDLTKRPTASRAKPKTSS